MKSQKKAPLAPSHFFIDFRIIDFLMWLLQLDLLLLQVHCSMNLIRWLILACLV
jgi:hypothetical protein